MDWRAVDSLGGESQIFVDLAYGKGSSIYLPYIMGGGKIFVNPSIDITAT